MKLRPISSEALKDIARNTDKLIMLSKYINEINSPIMFDNIYTLNSSSDVYDKIDSFNKDLDKTSTMILETLELVSTADSKGNVSRLKSEEKNLKVLFGENYSQERRSITIAGVEIGLSDVRSKDEIKDKILQGFAGIGIDEYKEIRKSFSALKKSSEKDGIDNSIKFLVVAVDTKKYAGFISKIDNASEEFSKYRRETSQADKRLIDSSITFSRGMVDSVIRTSTYITEKGLEQVSDAHKKDQILLKKLSISIKKSPYIDAVELDQSASIEIMNDLVDEVSSIGLNLTKKICLKGRKLGNYKAHGLYMESENIVAIDVSTGMHSTIHELAHAVDISNKDIYESQVRRDMINKYTQYLDLEDPLIKAKPSYYLNQEEVIARIAEVTYLLERHNHKDGEDMQDFIKRVRLSEAENNGKTGLAKGIDFYLENSGIYFDLEKLKGEDIKEMKGYYKAYFSVDGSKPESKYIRDIKVTETKPRTKRRDFIRDANIYGKTKNPYSGINSGNIKEIFEENKKHKIFSTQDLVGSILLNMTKISRLVKQMKISDINEQAKTVAEMGNWIGENSTKAEKVEILQDILPMTFHYHPSQTSASLLALKNAENATDSIKPFEMLKGIRSLYHPLRHASDNKKYHSAVFDSIKTLAKRTIGSDDIKIEDIASKLDRTDPLTHELYLNAGLAETLVDINLAPKGMNQIYDAARIAGASNEMKLVQNSLKSIANGDEPDTFELTKERLALALLSVEYGGKNKSVDFKEFRPSAVSLIADVTHRELSMVYEYSKEGLDSPLPTRKFQISGYGQSYNIPDAVFAFNTAEGVPNEFENPDEIKKAIGLVVEKMESSNERYQLKIKDNGTSKEVEVKPVKIGSQMKLEF